MSNRNKFRVEKLRSHLMLLEPCAVRATAAVRELALLEPAEPRYDAPGDPGP